jgi:hypothetical protein
VLAAKISNSKNRIDITIFLRHVQVMLRGRLMMGSNRAIAIAR